jgi:hypothetical protein
MSEDEKTINTGDEIHSPLPLPAARLLKEAAETPLDPTALDPRLARRKAVDRAHEEVRSRWPKLFRD